MKEPGSVTRTFIRMWDLYQICHQMPSFNHVPATGLFLNIPWRKSLWIIWFRSSPSSSLLQSYPVLPFACPPQEAYFMWVLNMKQNSYENKSDIARCWLFPFVWHGKEIRIMASACGWLDEPWWLFAWKYRITDSPERQDLLRVIYFSLNSPMLEFGMSHEGRRPRGHVTLEKLCTSLE